AETPMMFTRTGFYDTSSARLPELDEDPEGRAHHGHETLPQDRVVDARGAFDQRAASSRNARQGGMEVGGVVAQTADPEGQSRDLGHGLGPLLELHED